MLFTVSYVGDRSAAPHARPHVSCQWSMQPALGQISGPQMTFCAPPQPTTIHVSHGEIITPYQTT